jgi:DNA-binding GntR family transcriptional regulator
MFLESDFKFLEEETLKEAVEEKNKRINEAKLKIKKEKEEYLNQLNISTEKKILKEKYEKLAKIKKLQITQNYINLYNSYFKKKYDVMKNLIMEKIEKEKNHLINCFIKKLEKEYSEGELFIPEDLNISSKFAIKKHKLKTVIFKYKRKNIVLDFNEILENKLKSLKW